MVPPLPRHDRLRRLWAEGCRFLGCEAAILGGAMTWVSERHLVSAISEAGGFGVLACGAMSPELLAKEIVATQRLTDRPFGVNLIVMHPALKELIEVCLASDVRHLVLAGGLPPRDAVSRLKAAGVKVLAFAPSAGIARKLLRSGIDALIIEGMEAGGHIGPVSTSVLAQATRRCSSPAASVMAR
jgi:enoyl-[acyl-carrier protein] reductase II